MTIACLLMNTLNAAIRSRPDTKAQPLDVR
jgi:hypothetical protein